MAVFQDPSGRAPSLANLTLRGIGVLVVVTVAGYLLAGNATGKYEDNTTVTITTDAVGDGLKGGSEVKYRGFTVGKVSSVSGRDQSVNVKIELTGVNDDIRLRQGMAVNYTSASALGPTALEILDPGRGVLIRDGGSVYVSKLQSEHTSVSTLIRKLSKLVDALDQPIPKRLPMPASSCSRSRSSLGTFNSGQWARIWRSRQTCPRALPTS